MKRTSPSYLLFVLPGGTEKRLWSGHFPPRTLPSLLFSLNKGNKGELPRPR